MGLTYKIFDSPIEALDFVDALAKKRKHGILSSTLVEGVYDKRGQLIEGLYEWRVRWAE